MKLGKKVKMIRAPTYAPVCSECSQQDNEWVTCDGRNCTAYQKYKRGEMPDDQYDWREIE